MSTYVYCPRPSSGALEIVSALGAQRLRRFDGMDFWNKRHRFTPGKNDIIVCWGTAVPELEEVRVLNGRGEPSNKLDELRTLIAANVRTVFLYESSSIGPRGYVPRTLQHSGGADLLEPPRHPDYFVRRETFVTEYRIHSFDGRSIRAGVKVPRDGFVPVAENEWRANSNHLHPWVRSFDAGWRINYDGFQSTGKQRSLAHAAVKALGLTFGAVDLGETAGGELVVLEVNTAPGCEGGTTQAYVKAINRWIEGKEKGNDKGRARKREPAAPEDAENPF